MQQIDVLTAIDAVMDSIRVINSNLNRLAESSEKLYSRINILERDLHERAAKKSVYKSLLAVYPALVVILLFLVNTDHYKINSAVKDFKALSEDIKSLGLYANSNDYKSEQYFGEGT